MEDQLLSPHLSHHLKRSACTGYALKVRDASLKVPSTNSVLPMCTYGSAPCGKFATTLSARSCSMDSPSRRRSNEEWPEVQLEVPIVM